jgi:hypothetical protein
LLQKAARWAVALCLALMILNFTGALAESPAVSLQAELGYAGAITYMREIPFTITVKNDGPDIEGVIGVDVYRNEKEYDRYEMPITLASGAQKRVKLPVTLKMKQDSFRIELSQNNTVVKSIEKKPDRAINPEAVLVGVLSPNPQSVSYLSGSLNSASPDRTESWQPVTLDAESFPQTASLMDSFMILVVDGFDVATLSPVQQQVFDTWLKNGGIVLVGGGAQAATDYPYFSKFTNLAAGTVLPGEEITKVLAQYAIIDKPALDQPVLLNEITTADKPLVSGTHPLIYMHSAGTGLIYTAAFELGAKPLTGWAGLNGLWPRIILKSGLTLYSQAYNKLSTRIWGGSYNNMYLLDTVPIANDGSALPAIVLLAGYVLLAGIGSYLLLKRLDKREWMWLSIPLLTVVCVAGLYGLSLSLPFNKPIAATMASIQINEEGGVMAMSSAAVASPSGEEEVVSTADGTPISPIDQDSYYADPSNVSPTAPSPRQLKYRFLLGSEPAVGFPKSPAWTVNHLALSNTQEFTGGITARLWMEEDGLHAEIKNDTPYTLQGGLMLTSMGYASVGDLAPGQNADPALIKDTEAEKAAQAPLRLYETKIRDGQLISSSMTQVGSWDLYSILSAAIYPEEQEPGAVPYEFRKTLSIAEQQERTFKENALSQLLNMDWTGKGGGMTSPFHFAAFADEIGQAQLLLDGEPVTRTGHQAILDVLMKYEPVGPTGVVYYPPGMLPAYLAEIDNANKPHAQGLDPQGKNAYYQLSESPTFCFKLPDMTKMDISSLTIMPASYDSTPLLKLYNQQTGAWDEQTLLYLPMSPEKAQPYLSSQGELYIQFVSSSASRDFDGMMAPSVALEGRMK